MDNFIRGTLEKNEDGATYEGVVYDRFLEVRHANGQLINIFDMGEPISVGITEGEIYQFIVVAALPTSLDYFSNNPTSEKSSRWQGTIKHKLWTPTENAYPIARPELFSHPWAVIRTPLGSLLMNPNEISDLAEEGGHLCWEESRLDLYAII